jgi:hypothetical protein
MRRDIRIKKEDSAKTAVVLTIGMGLMFAAIAASLPYYNPVATAQQTNQTSAGGAQNNSNSNTGIGNVKTIPKIANLPPGNNTKIITQDKNIANPNTFKTFGKEHGINANTPPSVSQLPKNMTSSGSK